MYYIYLLDSFFTSIDVINMISRLLMNAKYGNEFM